MGRDDEVPDPSATPGPSPEVRRWTPPVEPAQAREAVLRLYDEVLHELRELQQHTAADLHQDRHGRDLALVKGALEIRVDFVDTAIVLTQDGRATGHWDFTGDEDPDGMRDQLGDACRSFAARVHAARRG